MSGFFEDVVDFRRKFGLGLPPEPVWGPEDTFLDFRQALLAEETREAFVASNAGDIEELADALVDVTFIALGTAAALGIDFNSCWDAVLEANMQKVRAVKPEETKRNHIFDLVKPDGWVPPDIERILHAQTHGSAFTGRMGPLEEAWKIRQLKEADYQRAGVSRDDYFPFGLTSHAQMIWVKCQRLKSLHDSPGEAENESIRDTLLDLINYASFAIEAIDRGVI